MRNLGFRVFKLRSEVISTGFMHDLMAVYLVDMIQCPYNLVFGDSTAFRSLAEKYSARSREGR